jgi:ABC-type sugar transport system permease subunit
LALAILKALAETFMGQKPYDSLFASDVAAIERQATAQSQKPNHWLVAKWKWVALALILALLILVGLKMALAQNQSPAPASPKPLSLAIAPTKLRIGLTP